MWGRDDLVVHHRHHDPIIDYRCAGCRRVFNAFTGTLLQGTKRRPVELVLIHRGFAQGVPTAQLARELGGDRKKLPQLRHRLQHAADRFRDQSWLDDEVMEADEMYQNAGEKGIPHDDPDDPPRRRANSRWGHGTFDTDRPPSAGVVGRESGEVRLDGIESASGSELDDVIDNACLGETTVNTDEWNGYNRVGRRHGRVHRTVDHSGPRWTWAIDADGGV